MAVTWVNKSVVLAIHDEQLAEHGGLSGMRDVDAVDAALARPINLALHQKVDVFDLASCYAVGFAKGHYFNDGNKRVSLSVTELFLDLNGYELVADDAEVVETWLAVASGQLNECELARWLRGRSRPGTLG